MPFTKSIIIMIFLFSKSLIYFSPSVPDQLATTLSTCMGVRRTSNLGFYLGHQLSQSRSNQETNNRLLQRIKSRLDGWKSECLLRVGRMTFAKTVINNMSIFYMQLYKLPTAIHKEVDRCVKMRLGSSVDKRRIHLVA